MRLSKDGRTWRIGTAADVDWIGGRPNGDTIETALPLVFDAYATFYPPDGVTAVTQERAVVAELVRHTAAQAWWLGFLETGITDVVFPSAPRVFLYWQWPYVLVEAGPEQALTWRTGHMRDSTGAVPDLFFPVDRSWLVSALWDDAWTCIGGPAVLIEALVRNPLVHARRVQPDEDVVPPGLTRWM
jgi:hypothetical protein